MVRGCFRGLAALALAGAACAGACSSFGEDGPTNAAPDADGGDDAASQPSPDGGTVDGAPPREGGGSGCAPPCTPVDYATVPNARSIACSPNTLHVGTSDGKLYAIPRGAPTPTPVLQQPDPAGTVSGLLRTGLSLYYSVAGNSEVWVRDLGTNTDVRLAANQLQPRGLARDGNEVLFVTAEGVRAVHVDGGANQFPATRVSFGDAGPGDGLAFEQDTYVVAHPSSFSLRAYDSQGLEIGTSPASGAPAGVTSSDARFYWSQSNGQIHMIDLVVGAVPQLLVTDEPPITGVCFHGKTLFFVAGERVKRVDPE